ncbi:hypothetical protein EI982_10900 [Haloplanus rallus]|jgi:hypothetical protein|uniref:Uncharacterized protein n=1 Tax=Haloplanus rallus TaxID=1816183 RepID=A0A6B9F479_9EURY|nr:MULTISPECIES: hypothetical protein [Haloplanus]QGX95266.1 hypothetical protein EI982_10900 [Haloplanus rallus]
MAFELGFLVGSLAILGVVLYFTRIRGPSLPHEAMAEGEGEGPDGDARAVPPERTVPACELCGENPAARSVNDMQVCPECDEELLT